MPDILIGLDAGNGDTKVISSEVDSPIVYPSVIGELNSYDKTDLIHSRNQLDHMSLITDRGKEFAVGVMALKNSTIRSHDVTDDKYTSRDQMLLTHTAFNLASNFDFTNVNMIIGLPLHRMNMAQQVMQNHRGIHAGTKLGFFGEYPDRMKTTCVNKIKVIPQPHGTLFNLILDSNGEIAERELAKGGVAIFDIGYKTNDGVVFRNLEPIGRLAIHSKNGMHVAYNEIVNKINNNFNGLEVKPFEIPQIIKTGTIRGVGVQEIINDAFYSLASNIIMEVKNKWDDAWEIETIVFTGGGSNLLKPYLEQVFSATFASQTSNVEGMLKYAKRVWGRDSR